MHDQNPAPGPRRPQPGTGCPECGAPLTGILDRCPRCALPLRGPAAVELWRLDQELVRLRAREANLLVRRGHLLDLLRAERARPVERFPAAPRSGVGSATGPGPETGTAEAEPGTRTVEAGAAVPASRKDFSPKAVQNLLLILGGLLLIVAAVVFTVVSWGHIGIGGRAAILAGVTALTFAAPKLLVGRRLGATAETVTMFGLALLFLDGYAARRVGLLGADGLDMFDYAALLFGLAALLMAGYSRLLPLRLPSPVAIVLAQFPLPLLALDEASPWLTAALAATAAGDAALLALSGRPRGAVTPEGGVDGVAITDDGGHEVSATEDGGHGDAVTGSETDGDTVAAGEGRGDAVPEEGRPRLLGDVTAGVCFGMVWSLGVAYGFLDSVLGWGDSSYGGSLAASSVKGALLVALAAIGLVTVPRIIGLAVVPRITVPQFVASPVAVPRVADGRLRLLTAGSMFALATGLAAPFWRLLPSGWWGVPYTAGALAAAAVALYLPGLNDPRVRSAGAVSAGVLAGITALPFVPWTVITLLAPFTGLEDVWSGPHDAAGDRWFSPIASAPVVLGLLAVAAAMAARRGRPVLSLVALATGTVAVAVVPDAFGWGHSARLAVLLLLAVVLVACLTLVREPRWASALTAAAVPVAVLGAVTALAARSETYVALAVLTAGWAAAAFAARVPRVAATALAAAVLSATGLIWAVAVGTRWQPVDDGLSLSLAIGAVLAVLLSLRYRSARPGERAPAGTWGSGDPRWDVGQWLSVVLAVLAVPPIAGTLARILGFYRPLVFPWTALRDPAGRSPILVVIVVLLAVTAVTASWQVAGRKGALRAGLLAWPVVLATLPISVALPYGVEVGLFVAGLGPSAWMAARSRTNWRFGAVAGLWTASFALSWALAAEAATLIALPVVALVAAATAFRGREREVRAGAAGLATLLAGGEALAAGMALEWPVRHTAFAVLAVACAAAAVAGRFRRAPFAIGVETAGYVLAVVGLSLAAESLPVASLACATAGVMMAGTALRPDRRWAGYVGTALLLVASWLRLLASDITVVEAYTVPFSVVLLVFGWWRTRGRAVSSWAAYGTGLASSLLPSVLAMLAGTGWVRPLLLGAASLAVLLVGARFRLQAPALLGGITLAVVALHELAPWIAQIVMAVPRWVPMALGGLLLVVVGATYEARLRDVRRLRAVVGRMH